MQCTVIKQQAHYLEVYSHSSENLLCAKQNRQRQNSFRKKGICGDNEGLRVGIMKGEAEK